MEDTLFQAFRNLEAHDRRQWQDGLISLRAILEDIAGAVQEVNARRTATSRKPLTRTKASVIYSTPKVREFMALQDNFVYNVAGRLADFVIRQVPATPGMVEFDCYSVEF